MTQQNSLASAKMAVSLPKMSVSRLKMMDSRPKMVVSHPTVAVLIQKWRIFQFLICVPRTDPGVSTLIDWTVQVLYFTYCFKIIL
jgi:hypothetical protein